MTITSTVFHIEVRANGSLWYENTEAKTETDDPSEFHREKPVKKHDGCADDRRREDKTLVPLDITFNWNNRMNYGTRFHVACLEGDTAQEVHDLRALRRTTPAMQRAGAR